MHDPRLSRLFDRYRAKNDLSALAEVFDAVSPELLRVARHVAGRHSDPEDLVQATFLAAIEHAAAYDAARPLVPWLLGILTNVARSSRRRATAHLAEEIEDGLAAGTRPLDDAEAGEIGARVQAALANLPDTYRDVLVPHLAEGKKPHEIAEALGRPQGTVRAQIHRGLRHLRRALPAGLSLGVAALLSGSALAGVRERVLVEGARAAGLPSEAAQALGVAAARRLALRRVAAASIVIAIAVGTWLAWPRGDGALAPTQAGVARAAEDAGELAATSSTPARAAASPAPAATIPEVVAVAPTRGVAVVAVTREHDGAPVAGARVRLIAWGDPAWFETPREARTGTDGMARFEALHPGRIGVLVEDGAQLREDVVAGRETRVEARLASDVAVLLRVVDARGEPVAGARVAAYDERGGASVATSAPTDVDGRVAMPGLRARQFVAAHAAGHAPSRLVSLASPAFARDARATPAIVDCVLDGAGSDSAGAEVAGRIVDEGGRAVRGARVHVLAARRDTPEFGPDGGARFERAPAETTSDATGAFRLVVGDVTSSGSSSEPRWLRVEAEGFALHESLLAPRADDLGAIDVRLERPAVLRGVVRFADGTPAAFAQVRVEAEASGGSAPRAADAPAFERASFGDVSSGGGSPSGVSSSVPSFAASTLGTGSLGAVAFGAASRAVRADAAGAFAFLDLPAGRTRLAARSGLHGEAVETTLDLVAGASATWSPVVPHVATIRGRAVGEDGRVVRTWLVLAVPEESAGAAPTSAGDALARSFADDPAEMALQCWIDPNGDYVVPCRARGTHRVELRPRDAWQGPVQALRRGVAPGSTGIDLRVPRVRGLAHGRVVGAGGSAADVVAVTSHGASVSGTGRAQFDRATGTFRIDLVPGEHELVAWPARGRPRWIATVVVQGVERVDVPDVVWHESGRVRVEVAGPPPARLELRRATASGAPGSASRVDLPVVLAREASGAFVAADVAPGAYVLVATTADGRRDESPLDVAPGELATRTWRAP